MSPVTTAEVEAVLEQADVLHSEAEVEAALDRMAAEITASLAGKNPLLLCTMIGGIVTAGKLLTRLHFPLGIDYIHASRYRGETRGAELHWIARPSESVAGREVLIIDDIFDEGLTLKALIEDCRQAGATAVHTAVLVEKQCDKRCPLEVDFLGLHVEDRYVFGYGMDYKGYLRNANGIYAVKEG
ncbi:hypoxanthine-guanine phosphoribosyltransferase [Sulfuriflexus mobilis]|uniref:hypoxanthine-guanine phosphoribosyltransferase n=1 Tax=Sulfuriflexus mobilis TaxID=1811807 RepID=UPI000F84483B|nr:hypoxanthine-guanine phosphoribosyltransferase [Sulfuriflexus mobilis]